MSLGALITGIAHIGIRVHDLPRSRAFYERLGFVFVAGPLGPEPVALLKHPAGIEINLILNAAAASAPNMLMDIPVKYPGYTHMALSVGDLDAAEAALREAGLRITGSRGDSSTRAAVFVRDPDGNVIELVRLHKTSG